MNLEDEQKLKFDRRLRNRRGWVSDQEVRGYEEGLPDVADKVDGEEAEKDAPATEVGP